MSVSTPGLSSRGDDSRHWIMELSDGSIIFSRAESASSNLTFPVMALAVQSATTFPFPKESARTSIPSSVITVESTSKQTASACANASMAPAILLPSNDFDFSPNDAKISTPFSPLFDDNDRAVIVPAGECSNIFAANVVDLSLCWNIDDINRVALCECGGLENRRDDPRVLRRLFDIGEIAFRIYFWRGDRNVWRNFPFCCLSRQTLRMDGCKIV
mmetsp:Transcript_65385/g.77401  ORF Transcript_65385/g.77401 Transcript_65385/m.77401 type:complete len:216 (+) Transcript_65385:567-1214(+)